jgi:hypothetical protein
MITLHPIFVMQQNGTEIMISLKVSKQRLNGVSPIHAHAAP